MLFHAVHEMQALLFQRFAQGYARTDDVAIADRELMLGVVDRLLRAGLHALLEDADRLLWVQIVEDDSFITAYGNYLPYFIRINPTHVNVCSNVVRIAKLDKAHILA